MKKSIEDLITSLQRELRYRKIVYPKSVERNQMKASLMNHEIACTEQTIEILNAIKYNDTETIAAFKTAGDQTSLFSGEKA